MTAPGNAPRSLPNPAADEALGSLPPRAGGGAPQPATGRLRTWGRFVRFEHTLFSLPLLFAGVLLGAGGLAVPLPLLGLVLLAGTGPARRRSGSTG